MTALPSDSTPPHRRPGSIHTCHWCDHMRPCEQAQAGTGFLWICESCAASRLELSTPEHLRAVVDEEHARYLRWHARKICKRCGLPVVKEADRYEKVFEQMHWVCFHFEFEHTGDPDDPCDDPSCPIARARRSDGFLMLLTAFVEAFDEHDNARIFDVYRFARPYVVESGQIQGGSDRS